MSQHDLKRELQGQVAEPLLPVEKKLIAASLGLGLTLLLILGLISRLA
jgi:hypothetical protein